MRDAWYSYVANGKPYASEHIRVSRQNDGTFCYEVESRMLLDVLGQKQEKKTNAKYVVTSQYEPVSLDIEESRLAGTSHTRGRLEKGHFLVVYQCENVRRTATIDLSGRPLFAPCLDDWLAEQPAEIQKYERPMFEESALELQPTVATREKAEGGEAVWSVSFGAGFGHGRLTLDRDGLRRELDVHAPRVHSMRVTAEKARDLHYRVFAPREVLMFPVGKPIGVPERLTSLTVRLAWKDLPFDRFHLTDERQQIVRHTEENGRCEVLLRIQPAVATKLVANQGLSTSEQRRYLSENRFIKPQDPDILRQARAWAGEQANGLEAVRKLSNGVFKHLQGGVIVAETLSGPEVLHNRKGKCSEYAILFASLARSIGFPTRIVLGMRMVCGSRVGHMWNEAYVDDRWITVDTTADEVCGSPALLKLVHSDDVLGTAAVRWGVVESLEVSVEDVEPRPSIAAGKTGIDGATYTNVELACRLTAPDKSWVLADAKQTGVPVSVIRFQVPNQEEVKIHFVAFTTPPVLTPALLIQTRAAQFKMRYHKYEVLRDEDFAVGSMAGRIFVFRRAESKDNPRPVKTTEILWTDGSSSFLLNLIAEEEAHDEYAADYFKLLKSFESLRTR